MEQRSNKNQLRFGQTHGYIKDTFLYLLRRQPFPKITVTGLCRAAGINRGTFYLHFSDIYEVLDEVVNDALLPARSAAEATDATGTTGDSAASSSSPSPSLSCSLLAGQYQCPYALCDRIHENPRYAPLFFDDFLSSHIIDSISSLVKESYLSDLMYQCDLSYEQAETIFLFQIHGCLAVNKRIYQSRQENWEESRDLIGDFILSGLRRFAKPAFSGDGDQAKAPVNESNYNGRYMG